MINALIISAQNIINVLSRKADISGKVNFYHAFDFSQLKNYLNRGVKFDRVIILGNVFKGGEEEIRGKIGGSFEDLKGVINNNGRVIFVVDNEILAMICFEETFLIKNISYIFIKPSSCPIKFFYDIIFELDSLVNSKEDLMDDTLYDKIRIKFKMQSNNLSLEVDNINKNDDEVDKESNVEDIDNNVEGVGNSDKEINNKEDLNTLSDYDAQVDNKEVISDTTEDIIFQSIETSEINNNNIIKYDNKADDIFDYNDGMKNVFSYNEDNMQKSHDSVNGIQNSNISNFLSRFLNNVDSQKIEFKEDLSKKIEESIVISKKIEESIVNGKIIDIEVEDKVINGLQFNGIDDGVDTLDLGKEVEDLNKFYDEINNIKSLVINFIGGGASYNSLLSFYISLLLSKIATNVLLVDLDFNKRSIGYINKDISKIVNNGHRIINGLEMLLSGDINPEFLYPGLGVITTSLSLDLDRAHKIEGYKLNRFLLNAKKLGFKFIIFDIPLSDIELFKELVFEADKNVITVLYDSFSIMKLAIKLGNIEDEDLQEYLYTNTTLLLTGYDKNKTIFNSKIKDIKKSLIIVDRYIMEAIKASRLDYYISDMNILGGTELFSNLNMDFWENNKFLDKIHIELLKILRKLFM